MRGSIPAIVVVCIYFIDGIFNSDKKEWKIALLIVFTIGFVTPFYEYKRAIVEIVNRGKINLVADDIITFSDKEVEDYINFISVHPKETAFYKYIGKELDK